MLSLFIIAMIAKDGNDPVDNSPQCHLSTDCSQMARFFVYFVTSVCLFIAVDFGFLFLNFLYHVFSTKHKM